MAYGSLVTIKVHLAFVPVYMTLEDQFHHMYDGQLDQPSQLPLGWSLSSGPIPFLNCFFLKGG